MRKPASLSLGIDKGLYVRMVAAQNRHHRTASSPVGRHGFAHRVPQPHERHRAAGDISGALRWRSRRTNGRKVQPDTATLLQRNGAFAKSGEQAVNGIVENAHHETIQQGRRPVRSGIGQDTSAGQETIIRQDVVKSRLPGSCVTRLDRCNGVRDAPPRILNARLGTEAVFLLPDVFRDRGRIAAHACWCPRTVFWAR